MIDGKEPSVLSVTCQTIWLMREIRCKVRGEIPEVIILTLRGWSREILGGSNVTGASTAMKLRGGDT